MNEPIPPSDLEEKLFGEMLVKEGLVKPEQVRECFVLQDELRARKVSPLPKLGELLRQKGYLTPEAYQQTATLDVGPKQESIETDSLEKVPLPPEVIEAVRKEENRFGKYVRVAPLGAGGMGEVWKAWDTDLGRWVALKFLKAANPDNLLRFRREAQTAGQIDHPHIADIYEVGEKSGNPFIAMQYVEGVTLTTFPRNDIRELVRLMRDTALAVHAAHEKGIIHRDLKPANIMVGQKESAHIYVMDFGLAKEIEVDTSLSQSGFVLGTPAYMAPEQAQGKAKFMDARSDVYSLGATLYKLLAGHPPFQDKEVLELLRKVVETDPPPLRKENPDVEPDLETIVMKCLRKEPGKRYPTAAALAADLENYLKGESILARQMGLAEKGSRWMKKNRMLTGMVAALILVTVLGSGYLLLDPWWKEMRTRADVNGVLKEFRSGNVISKEEAQRRLLEHRDRATVALLAEELDTLTETLKKNKKLDPGQTEYLKFLCETLGLLGIREGAVEALGRYLEAEQWNQQLRAVPAGKSLCNLGGRKADRFLLQMRIYFGKDNRFWKQVSLFYVRTGVEPQLEEETASGYNKRGIAREAKGNIEGAIVDYTRAIALDETLVVVWTNRGNALHKKREYDRAIGDYTRAIVLDPKYFDAWINRGVVRDKRGDIEGAIKDYTEALRLDKKRGAAWTNRGNARARLGDLEGAVLDHTHAIECDPKMGFSWNNRGKVHYKRGDIAKAIADLTRAIELDSNYTEALFNRGMVRVKKGDLDGAIADFTRAIELDANYVAAWNYRGSARYKKGDLDGAIADFTRTLKINPNYHIAWLGRGSIRHERGDLAEAIADYEQLLKRASNHPKAPALRAQIKKMRAHLEKQKEK